MRLSFFFPVFCCAASWCFCLEGLPDPDRIATAQALFLSAASKGMADAGVALPWNMAGAGLNPALLYSCRNGAALNTMTAYTGYGRDSLFDRFIFPVGITTFQRREALGFVARTAMSGFGRDQYDVLAIFCRRLWTRSQSIGALDAGANVRYSYAPWQTFHHDTLYATRSWLDAQGRKLRPDEKTAIPPFMEPGKCREHRFALDLGVFKPEFASHIDVGIAVEHLVGYRWGLEWPRINRSRDTVSLKGDTTIVLTTPSYRREYESYTGWVPLRYTVLRAGWNWRIGNPGGRFSVSIPVDFAAHGLFDRTATMEVAVHCGVQLHVMRDIFIRAGFEHGPGTVAEGLRHLTMRNNVTFGASVLPAGLPVVIDVYATYYQWGTSVSVDW